MRVGRRVGAGGREAMQVWGDGGWAYVWTGRLLQLVGQAGAGAEAG